MFIDLLEYLKEKNESGKIKENKNEKIKNEKFISIANERDKSINKLSFLGFRIIRKLLDSHNKSDLSILNLFKNWSILVQLEKIGDELKRIFRLYNNYNIDELTKEMYSLYIDTMKIFYNEKKPNFRKKNLETNESIRNFRRKIKRKILKEENVELTQIYEKMINISSYLEEILRLNFDFS